MGIGGVVGAVGGWAFSAAAPALAGTSFFASFGASGTVTAYSVVGTVAGGATGYGAGFGAGLYTSGGDFSYANQMGGVMAGVGAQIGSVAGMAGGGWAAYSSQMAKAATGLASKEAAKTAAGESAKGGESIIKGFTQHATNQAATRGFKTADILKIVKEGTPVQTMGRYGVQIRYTLGGNTVVLNAQGKIVTVFSNASGTANGLGKGFFIPFE
jgi:hypothetical protein